MFPLEGHDQSYSNRLLRFFIYDLVRRRSSRRRFGGDVLLTRNIISPLRTLAYDAVYRRSSLVCASQLGEICKLLRYIKVCAPVCSKSCSIRGYTNGVYSNQDQPFPPKRMTVHPLDTQMSLRRLVE